ncbi:MAG: hypothetical protein V4736_05535 [Bdellovibrionota bacterium]
MKLILTLILSYSPMLMACPSDSTPTTVTYEVPVKNPELLPYATFQIDSYEKAILEDGRTQMKYTLPAHLTGKPVDVVFTSKSSQDNILINLIPGEELSTVLEGPNGKMKCKSGTCKVKYKNLPMDINAREEFLKQISQSEVELIGRKEVAKGFTTDPGGIFRYLYEDKK